MGKLSFVTETPQELFENAEKDLININILNKIAFYPADRMYSVICFHATQAVEKFLKGYIINAGKNAEKIHDLEKISLSAKSIDNSFSKIENECSLLNKFTESIRYSPNDSIVSGNIKNILNSVQTVADFPPIKTLREQFAKENKWSIVTQITTGATTKRKKSSERDLDDTMGY